VCAGVNSALKKFFAGVSMRRVEIQSQIARMFQKAKRNLWHSYDEARLRAAS